MLLGKVVDSLRETLPKVGRFSLPAISYGFPSLLLIILAYKIIWATIFGVPPAPQIPPNGYKAEEDQIRLYWRRGDHKGGFEVQVASDCDFSKPVFSAKTNKTDLVLPRLEAGRKYCWRVLNDDSAIISRFSTSKMFVAY